MSNIAFHFGAPDKLAYACRLLRKAVNAGARVLVLVPPDAAARLDADLWALAPTDFLAHCDARAGQSQQERSRVVLTDDAGAEQQDFGVLVNLSHEMPQHFEQFGRVIEVVSLAEDDRQFARARWKRYTELGYSIERHDLKLKGAM